MQKFWIKVNKGAMVTKFNSPSPNWSLTAGFTLVSYPGIPFRVSPTWLSVVFNTFTQKKKNMLKNSIFVWKIKINILLRISKLTDLWLIYLLFNFVGNAFIKIKPVKKTKKLFSCAEWHARKYIICSSVDLKNHQQWI